MLIYVFLQVAIWWLSQVISLFSLVFFPVKAKNFMKSSRARYLHIAVVAAGILAPVLSPLAIILSGVNKHDNDPEKLGFLVLIYPPYRCVSIRKDVHFYTFTLPFNFMVTIGASFLVLIFWKLYTVRPNCIATRQ